MTEYFNIRKDIKVVCQIAVDICKCLLRPLFFSQSGATVCGTAQVRGPHSEELPAVFLVARPLHAAPQVSCALVGRSLPCGNF